MGSDKYNFNSLATQAKKDLAETLQDFKMGDLDLKNLKNSDLINLQRLLTPKMSKYIPHTPTPKQTAFLLLNCKEAFYGGAAGGGKLLKLETPIFTNSGWKTVGTLTEIDKIIALDGSWTDIEYITPTKISAVCYKITFSNGEVIYADKEHLWTVDKKKQINKNHRHQIVSERITINSQQIFDDGILYKANNKIQKRYMLPQHYGYLGSEQDLPIAPYLLGLWLGDGNSNMGYLTVNTSELPFIQTKIETLGYTFEVQIEQSGCFRVLIPTLYTSLRKCNLLNNKHIPEQYFLSSRQQRVELLQGLMDSDGYCQERGRCEWSQKVERQQLFDNVCNLIASLGYKYSTSIAPSSCRGVSFPSNRVTFTPREYVATLPNKIVNMFNDGVKDSDSAIYIDKMEVAENCEMKCIRIKHTSHVFLVGKTFIPTHNSDALLMGGLQYVDVQGYSGIIFRKTYADLTKPGALIDRAKSWLLMQDGTRWNDKDKRFEFYEIYGPHKNTVSNLQFGYLENSNDKFNYQGGEYQYIGFDELTHIDEASYKYMFSRLRRLKNVKIPLRVRGASNPPEDDGGIWVKKRFIDEGPAKGRVFIPAGMNDNPYLDTEEYEEALQELDPISRARLKDGNWEIVRKGNMFKRSWVEIVDSAPIYGKDVRWWDMAASDEEKAAKRNKSNEPDYTASVKCREFNGVYYVTDIIRERLTPVYTEQLQQSTAKQDGHMVSTFEEQEPGSSGIAVISNKSRTIFKGYAYKGMNSTGSKVQRAQIASAACENHNIKIVKNCRNIDVFLDELESFPGGIHDDMVDCLSGCITQLSTTKGSNMPIIVESVTNSDARWADEIDLLPGYYEGVDSRW